MFNRECLSFLHFHALYSFSLPCKFCIAFRDLWRYNISTNEWVSMKTDDKMPSELASHSGAG